MSAQLQMATRTRAKSRLRVIIISVAAVVLVAAMALDTKVVKIGSAVDIAITKSVFSPAAFGAAEFPKDKVRDRGARGRRRYACGGRRQG